MAPAGAFLPFSRFKQSTLTLVWGAIFVTAGLLSARAADPLAAEYHATLSVLGSSVAKGYGASGTAAMVLINGSISNSYAARLTVMAAANGWRVVNQSVGGDSTARVINRFDTDEVPVHAEQVFIGLSLGNEGLAGAANPAAVCAQFFSGITNLIALSRSNHLQPLLGNQYPKDAYSRREYGRLKQMDLRLNTLAVPSVNFLGATDDGAGHWVNNAFINLNSGDGTHPSDAGFNEMFLAIVPGVFEAVRQGKTTPQWGDRAHCLRLTGSAGQPAPLSFTPGGPMHSFTLSFRVRSTATGTVAGITLPAGCGQPTVEMTASGPAYHGLNGVLNNPATAGTNGAWHNVVVAHQYARGLTWFYVDGMLSGMVAERLTPVGFVLGGPGQATTRPAAPAQADYADWFVHRSLLNAEEVAAQLHGNLQQASLELYAPLDDATFTPGGTVTNRAQSLAAAVIHGDADHYQSVPSQASPAGGRHESAP